MKRKLRILLRARKIRKHREDLDAKEHIQWAQSLLEPTYNTSHANTYASSIFRWDQMAKGPW